MHILWLCLLELVFSPVSLAAVHVSQDSACYSLVLSFYAASSNFRRIILSLVIKAFGIILSHLMARHPKATCILWHSVPCVSKNVKTSMRAQQPLLCTRNISNINIATYFYVALGEDQKIDESSRFFVTIALSTYYYSWNHKVLQWSNPFLSAE